MRTPALLRLALSLLWRERSAAEVRTLFWSLLIAVSASCSIGFFSARLQEAMVLRASEFLAADLVLSGSQPAANAQIDKGLALGLQHAQSVEFSSMLASDQGLQLASVKAVAAPYPLRGELKSTPRRFAEEQAGGLPQPGELWAEARLAQALGIEPGARIEVGAIELTLTRLLTYEPDRAGDFYSLTPRALINLGDLAATQVVQPGSRVRYRDYWRGSAEAVRAYRQQAKPSLAAHQQLLDARGGNTQVGGALSRAERYLNLASLAALLLAGVAVALSASRFATRRYDTSALLRCFGLQRRQITQLFCIQLLALGLFASLLGALLGWLGHLGLLHLLGGLLPEELPTVGWLPALAGVASGLITLAGFALPPLLNLGRVSPLRVLRRDLQPLPVSAWLSYALAIAALGLIMWRLSLDWRLTLALLGGGLLTCLLLGSLLWLALRSLRRALENAPLGWRLGLGQLLRHPLAATGQAMAFGLILLAMGVIGLLRGELLDNWQNQLPSDAPNHFAMNILPEQRQAFVNALEQQGAQSQPLFPLVPGRLIAINQQPVQQLVSKDSQGERAIQRDLGLTWAADLPVGNKLTAGAWLGTTRSGLPGVSVESKLAENLKIQLGDRLTFSIAGQTREVEVSSLREVDWDSFQPNFYMVFAPGVLDDLPLTYLTSFHLPKSQEGALLPLSRQFPSVTLLQVDAILEQLRSILAQVSLAVEYVLLFVLAAGLCVLFAGLQATLDERLKQGAILRALGSSRRLLQQARLREFALLGTSSGILAMLGCELVSYLLYHFVLDIAWQPHPWLLLLPLAGGLLVSIAGSLGTRRVIHASPLSVLRES